VAQTLSVREVRQGDLTQRLGAPVREPSEDYAVRIYVYVRQTARRESVLVQQVDAELRPELRRLGDVRRHRDIGGAPREDRGGQRRLTQQSKKTSKL
jgi:hypothetical protein